MSQGGSSGLKFNSSVKSQRKESASPDAKSQSPSIKIRKSSCMSSSIEANASIASSDIHMFMEATHHIWKWPVPSHRERQKTSNSGCCVMVKVNAAIGDKDSFAIVPNSSFMTNSTTVSSANYVDS